MLFLGALGGTVVPLLVTSSGVLAAGRWSDPDSGFGGDGKVTTALGGAPFTHANALAFQADHRLVVAGQVGFDFGLARYNQEDGALDERFGQSGRVTTSFGSGIDEAEDLAIQADGKIVVAGHAQAPNSNFPDFAVARYTRDGELDPSFDSDGKVTTAVSPAGDDQANAVAIQPDGKIVVAGFSTVAIPPFSQTGRAFTLVRYDSNGNLDPTFGTGGVVTTSIGGDSVAFSLELQPDGKIIAAGETQPDLLFTRNFALARYNSDGSMDATFNPCDLRLQLPCGGTLTTNLGSPSSAQELVLQPDGKIVAAGLGSSLSRGDFALARYQSDGRLDTSFGTSGTVLTDLGRDEEGAEGIAIHPDGRLTATGPSQTGFSSGGDIALARYRPDGALEPSFGRAGVVRTNVGPGDTHDASHVIALDSAGRAVVAGETASAFSLARYRQDGSLDPSFGRAGIVSTSFSPNAEARALAIQRDGKIIAVGTMRNIGRALVRYRTDGSLDPTFGSGGIVTTGDGSFAGAMGVALQSDDSIVVVAETFEGGRRVVALFRYKPNGSLDASFGMGGKSDIGSCGVTPCSLRVQDDDKIVVVGSESIPGLPPTSGFFVAKFSRDGTPDSQFDTDGRASIAFADGSAEAWNLVIQADGKIVIAGRYRRNFAGSAEFALARVDSTGSLDATTFNPCGASPTPSSPCGGRLTTPVSRGGSEAHDVVIQPAAGEERIVAVGFADSAFALARYRPNGRLDPTFNPCSSGPAPPPAPCGGMTTTRNPGYRGRGSPGDTVAPGASNGFAEGVAIQSDGTIVVAGRSPGGFTPSDFALARYRPDGTLDQCGAPGTVRAEFGYNAEAYDVAIQPDGKIVAAGLYNDGEAATSFALARFVGGRSSAGPTKVSIADAGRVTEPATGTADARFPVRLDAPACEQVRVDFTTADGSAKANEDYSAKTGRVIFEPGFDSATASVDVLADDEVEDNENFHVDLTRVGVGPAAPTDALPLPPGVLPGGRSLSVPDRRGTATIVDRDRSSQRGRTITPPPPPPPPVPEPPAALPPPPPPIQPPALPTLQPPPLGLGVPPPLTPPPAPVQPLTQPLTQAQQQGQQQAQQQMAQQVQQQMQAQLQAGFMLERERQGETERAGTEGRDANPDAYVASERGSDPVPTPALTWGAAAAALGVGLAYRRRSVVLARSPRAFSPVSSRSPLSRSSVSSRSAWPMPPRRLRR